LNNCRFSSNSRGTIRAVQFTPEPHCLDPVISPRLAPLTPAPHMRAQATKSPRASSDTAHYIISPFLLSQPLSKRRGRVQPCKLRTFSIQGHFSDQHYTASTEHTCYALQHSQHCHLLVGHVVLLILLLPLTLPLLSTLALTLIASWTIPRPMLSFLPSPVLLTFKVCFYSAFTLAFALVCALVLRFTFAFLAPSFVPRPAEHLSVQLPRPLTCRHCCLSIRAVLPFYHSADALNHYRAGTLFRNPESVKKTFALVSA
jgi:hypothetical protein